MIPAEGEDGVAHGFRNPAIEPVAEDVVEGTADGARMSEVRLDQIDLVETATSEQPAAAVECGAGAIDAGAPAGGEGGGDGGEVGGVAATEFEDSAFGDGHGVEAMEPSHGGETFGVDLGLGTGGIGDGVVGGRASDHRRWGRWVGSEEEHGNHADDGGGAEHGEQAMAEGRGAQGGAHRGFHDGVTDATGDEGDGGEVMVQGPVAGGFGERHGDGIHVGQAAEHADPDDALVGADLAGGAQDEFDAGVEEGEFDGGGEAEGVADGRGFDGVGGLTTSEPHPEREAEAGQGHEGEGGEDASGEAGVDGKGDDEDAGEHDGTGEDDGEGAVLGDLGMFAAAAAEGEGGGGGGGEAADEAGEGDPGGGSEQAHEDIAEESDAGDEDHHEPGGMGVEGAVGAEVLVGNEREDEAGDGDELEGATDVGGGEAAGPLVDGLLEAEEEHGEGGEEHGGLTFLPDHEGPGEEGGDGGHGGGVSGGTVARAEDLSGEQGGADQTEGDGEGGGGMGVGDERGGASDEGDEGEGAETGEFRFARGLLLVFPLADESDQRSQTSAEDQGFGRFPHVSEGSLDRRVRGERRKTRWGWWAVGGGGGGWLALTRLGS